MITASTHNPPQQLKSGTDGKSPARADIAPAKLAYLDVGLFFSLRRLGTSKERICRVLNLSRDEYDYLRQLG
jgi:hypothetical protein